MLRTVGQRRLKFIKAGDISRQYLSLAGAMKIEVPENRYQYEQNKKLSAGYCYLE